jgi:hypothetical protein
VTLRLNKSELRKLLILKEMYRALLMLLAALFRQFRVEWYSFLLYVYVRLPCIHFPQDAFCSELLSSTSPLAN